MAVFVGILLALLVFPLVRPVFNNFIEAVQNQLAGK
jgi:ABC-type transport system involved in cytochrome c biogenesis permease component